ncbi:MAG: hypothetical protein J7L11_05130 [Thermoprotei archaeon]|nr:hypothetical protein [Thermoprotei archaeon]
MWYHPSVLSELLLVLTFIRRGNLRHMLDMAAVPLGRRGSLLRMSFAVLSSIGCTKLRSVVQSRRRRTFVPHWLNMSLSRPTILWLAMHSPILNFLP